MSLRLKFGLILALAVVTALIAIPREDAIFKFFGIKNVKLQVKQGLDLQGGAQLVFQADLAKTPAGQHDQAMSSLVQVMQRRANIGGTQEVVVQQQGKDRVSVSLPGVKDVNAAIQQIGQTATLSFAVQASQGASPSLLAITGKDVSSADVTIDPQTSKPVVSLVLKGSAVKTFGDVTTQLNQTGGYLTILLDDQILFGPATVSSPITDGHAQLQGNFASVSDAKNIANLINSGALPVPVTLVGQNTVGPTLGKESVSHSLVAGLIGLATVAVFMLLYYRLAGAVAVSALVIYTTITLTLYKLSAFVPGYTIVLTLAGIAGFILSIGMAVDANILIFERLKEELRAGKSFVAATETAFDRAWTSIRDSNVSTLITCTILYLSSTATPIIRGFAVTLGLGVLVSLFTAVVITRTLLRLVIRQKWGRNPKWYGLKDSEVQL